MRRNRLLILLLGGLLGAAGVVGPAPAQQADKRMRESGMWQVMERMQMGQMPRGISPADLPERESPEAELYLGRCTVCHAPPDPRLHSADEWPGVLDRMENYMAMMKRGGVTPEEKESILVYLRRHARE